MAIQNASGIWYGLVVNGAANPGWFGAKGDGITDDTVAIQGALNTGSCQLEDYTYLIGGTNAALSIPSGGSLVGRAHEEVWAQKYRPRWGGRCVREGFWRVFLGATG